MKLVQLIEELARLRSVGLSPGWADGLPTRPAPADEPAEAEADIAESDRALIVPEGEVRIDDEDGGHAEIESEELPAFLDEERQATRAALVDLSAALGWQAPAFREDVPKAQDFPQLALVRGEGWVIALSPNVSGMIETTGLVGGTRPVAPDDIECFAFPIFPMPVSHKVEGDEKTPSAKSIFINSLMKRKNVFVTAILATLFANFLALITGLYSMQIYDRVIPRSGYATLIALTLGAAIGLMFDFILRSTRALMMEREAARVDEEVSEVFFSRTQNIRLDARPPQVGTLASQLRGIDQIRSLMSSSFLFLVADLPFALFFIFVIYLLGGVVAVVPLVAFPISLGLAFLFAYLIRADTDKAQITGNRKNGMLVESLDAAETVKANGGDWMMLGKWNQLVRDVHDYEDPIKRTTAVAASIFSSIQQIAYIGLIAFGAYLVTQGNMTIGALIACGIIAGRVNGPLISALPNFIVQAGYARSSLKALDSILALPNDETTRDRFLRPDAIEPRVEVNNLTFAYGEDSPVLDVGRLRIEPGERVVIIGGIGSGKSTLLKTLAGLYQPTQGQVLVSGIEASQIAPDILRRNVGYIQQEPRLLNGTLRENLILGLRDPGDEAIIEAANKTGLARMIASNPRGLGLKISEGGRGLSGGQRMLTLLTRLMLLNPKLLLLDEPTSNLDQNTEAVVLQQVVNLVGKDKTMVMVTHKLPLVRLGTRAIIMANGKIVHDDTPEKTLSKLQVRTNAKKPAKQQGIQRKAAGQ
ncbi:ATP-binding cassette domain-containing protein [Erythrobacter sp.]|uniref:ATP-binding cassette domain-containing protein n=1 Tax=Erythrobacter sp. TaxID=1042 RepID=UPI002EB80D06|nr:ATP-binding cassette domain-containing protein [Erythrobacter sp.]